MLTDGREEEPPEAGRSVGAQRGKHLYSEEEMRRRIKLPAFWCGDADSGSPV